MGWTSIIQSAVSLAIDIVRGFWKQKEEKEKEPESAWKYRDVKIANDASHAAGHEKERLEK